MNLQEYIDSKLANYSDAFDLYMDGEKIPDSLSDGDLLGSYLKTVLDANPQLDSQDPTWKEVLKDELMAYFASLIKAFYLMEEENQKEMALIAEFQKAQIEKQRTMWPSIYAYIKESYASTDVNIDGYVEQFKDNNVQDVINSLTSDWENASNKKLESRKENLLENTKNKWEMHVKEWGRTDFERRKKIEKEYYRYPVLHEIVKMIGRALPKRKDEKDDIICKYIPALLSSPAISTGFEQISIGNDLSNVIPAEIAMLSETVTETVFLKKYAEKQLSVFSCEPPNFTQKKIQKKQTKPRLEKGPIIVSIDTSGSMLGEPEKVAFSLLMQLIQLAKKQHRNCMIITFSIRTKVLELTKPGSWQLLKNFLENGFSGGTSGEQMLNVALDALQKKAFCMADVLIISDFIFPTPLANTEKRMQKEHSKGTRFYGLQIGDYNNMYEKVLDKIWKVNL